MISNSTLRKAVELTLGAYAIWVSAGSSLAEATIYAFRNVADTTTSAPSGTFTNFNYAPAISEGTAAFTASYSGGAGIFTSRGGGYTAVAKTGDSAPAGTFSAFGPPSIFGDTAAFPALYNDRTNEGIFRGSNHATTAPVVTTGDSAPSGTFTDFDGGDRTPDIRGSTTAFWGSYPGGEGLFTRGGTNATIVTRGDAAPSGAFTNLSGITIQRYQRGILR